MDVNCSVVVKRRIRIERERWGTIKILKRDEDDNNLNRMMD